MRSVASSRMRWATVMASVLAITKLPTNRAMPPKPSRKYLKTLMPSCVSFESAAALASELCTCVVVESSGRIWLTSWSAEAPGFAPTRIASSLPVLPNSRCAVS